jgi:hypothetical protein
VLVAFFRLSAADEQPGGYRPFAAPALAGYQAMATPNLDARDFPHHGHSGRMSISYGDESENGGSRSPFKRDQDFSRF